jgi:uncharacterized membrane protein YhhN
VASSGVNANQLLAAYTSGMGFNPEKFTGGSEEVSDEQFMQQVEIDTACVYAEPSLIVVPGNLMAQMAAFAVAHVFFMIFFFERYRHKVERDGKLTGKAKGYTFLIVFLGAVLISFIFSKVIPEVPDGILKIGTGLYALIACMMLELALFQRSTLYAAGALLFVFSDFILSWELFVEPIQGSRYLIMIPYYLGQLLLFLRATPYRIPGLRKHRM